MRRYKKIPAVPTFGMFWSASFWKESVQIQGHDSACSFVFWRCWEEPTPAALRLTLITSFNLKVTLVGP